MYARQLDQIVQQANYWGQELQPLVNAGQLFSQPQSFGGVMDTLQKVQSLSYSVQGLSWSMQNVSQLGNFGAGCQGILCANQAANLGLAMNGGGYAMTNATNLYNQVQAGLSAGAWASAPNPNPQTPSNGYVLSAP